MPSAAGSSRPPTTTSSCSRAARIWRTAPFPRGPRARLSVLGLLHSFAARYPQAFGHLLLAISFALHPPREVALAGADRGDLERVLRERLWPATVLAAG